MCPYETRERSGCLMLTRSQIITAIVTPFTAEGQIDYPALEKLTEYLLQSGTQGFVVGGTTGETPTLTHQEKLTLYQRFAQIVAGRVPVFAGCDGSPLLQ